MAELQVGIASLAIAAPPVLVPIIHCIHYIKEKLEQYQRSHRTANEQATLAELHLLNVQRLTQYLENRFAAVDNLSKDLLLRCTKIIESILLDFTSIMSTIVDKNGQLKRLKFTFRGRDALMQLNHEIADWEKAASNVLFFMTLATGEVRSATISVAEAKGSHLLKTLDLIERCLLQGSKPAMQSLDSLDTQGAKHLEYSPLSFDEEKAFEPQRTEASESEIADVATFLSGADPQIVGLLRCVGFRDHTTVYEVPQNYTSPQSLRKILLDARYQGQKFPLDDRFMVMKRLASAVFFVHCSRRVHKRVRSSNVILFSDSSHHTILGSPVLVGFEKSRFDAAHSNMESMKVPEEAYYLAVDRQGDPTRKYSMLDDVYSLGVVFLEIALWQSFMYPTHDKQTGHTSWQYIPILERSLKEKKAQGVKGDPAKRSQLCEPEIIRRTFVAIAKGEVPRRLGSSISSLIVSCLSCIDDPEAFKVGDLQDDSDVSLGVAYIKQVLQVLDSIHL